MKNIFWTAYSNKERHVAISAIQNVISQFGSITDFKPFSDISLSITIEIEAKKTKALYLALQEIISIDQYENPYVNFHKEITLYLNITFAKSTGNLKIEVPSV